MEKGESAAAVSMWSDGAKMRNTILVGILDSVTFAGCERRSNGFLPGFEIGSLLLHHTLGSMLLGFHRLLSRRSLACCFVLTTRFPSHAFVPISRSFASSSSSSLAMSSSQQQQKQVLVPIANGSEEIETTCITDTLTRFGAKVTIATVHTDGSLVCTMSRGLKVVADCSIQDIQAESCWDLIVLPGGMPGAEHLRDSAPLVQLLQQHKAAGKWYGALCAAPAVALSSLIDDTAPATCYPAPVFRDALRGVLSDEKVVVAPEQSLITSQGPGTALLFGLQLGEALFGKEKRDAIAKEMLVDE